MPVERLEDNQRIRADQRRLAQPFRSIGVWYMYEHDPRAAGGAVTGCRRIRVQEMKSEVRHYRGNKASVTFDTYRCIHAEVCVRGLPQVFDVSRRPWILSDASRRSENFSTGLWWAAPPARHANGRQAVTERVEKGAEAVRDHPARGTAEEELGLRRSGWAALRARQPRDGRDAGRRDPARHPHGLLPLRGVGEQASLRQVARAGWIPL